MKNVLVIGASGFVGRHLAHALSAAGHSVRCLVRTPSRAHGLEAAHEIMQGDITDAAAVDRAMKGMDAVYVSIHTISPQQAQVGFMDVEHQGLANVVKACRAQGTRRLVYITALGISPDGPGAWIRERWVAEERVLQSGLDVTVVRPGQIVGVGGQGFDRMLAQAKKPVAMVLGKGSKKRRAIGVEDLASLLVGVLEEPRAYGLRLDVGSDDVLTQDQMIDVAAKVLGRRPPRKVHVPIGLLAAVAPLLERLTRMPPGAVKGLVQGLEVDLVGDVEASRAILPRVPQGYEAAVRRAVAEVDSSGKEGTG